MKIIQQIMINLSDTTINQRIKILIDEFAAGSKAAFSSRIAVSPQSVHDLVNGRQGAPSFKVLSSILEAYPTVDANWLVLGQGEMLRGQMPSPIPPASELAQLIREYMQVSRRLDGQKAAYREAVGYLNQLQNDVTFKKGVADVQLEILADFSHLPAFTQEAKEKMQVLANQSQESLDSSRERHSAFMLLYRQAEEEMLETLKQQGELEKKLGVFINSVVPLTAEEPMNAPPFRQLLMQSINNPPF